MTRLAYTAPAKSAARVPSVDPRSPSSNFADTPRQVPPHAGESIDAAAQWLGGPPQYRLALTIGELGRHRGEAVGAVCHTNDICGVRADVDDPALPRGCLQRVELVQKPRYLIRWDLGVREDAHRGRHGSTICSSRS
jgi:hypothetical protein